MRLREFGFAIGALPTGPLNAITDVASVRVGQVTLIEGEKTRTGATAILPHGDNLYQDKVPAGLFVANGYGKMAGGSQLEELGEIETPILLTNTLAVGRGMQAVVDWTLAQPGNERLTSVNAIVGETNDGGLNDIRAERPCREELRRAIEIASEGPVAEGCVGAGAGTIAFGWKGGIGTSSRVLPGKLGGYRVGALAQTNFGGILQIGGVRVGEALGQFYLKEKLDQTADGSVMIVIATDAPLSDRNLKRLAARGAAGLARTGAAMSNGSGDYVIAFSTHPDVRRTAKRRKALTSYPDLPNDQVSPLFLAAIEAVEEAIVNSLFAATTTRGFEAATGKTRTIQALPREDVLGLFQHPPSP
ncbi:MAG: P1 family peptidase [Elsteraceae bacterium]